MYKFDSHVHTSESSPCGALGAEDTVRLYKEAGFSGLCITDHYLKNYGLFEGSAPWRQTMDRYLEGYRKAKECGDKLDLTVLLGVELTTGFSGAHYLLYGITERFLYDYPHLYDYSAEELYKLAKEHGFLVFQAHPFRGSVPDDPRYLDGVEVLNASNLRSVNNMAEEFAKNNRLLICAGSDCHNAVRVGASGIMTRARIQSVDALKDILLKGDIELIRPGLNINGWKVTLGHKDSTLTAMREMVGVGAKEFYSEEYRNNTQDSMGTDRCLFIDTPMFTAEFINTPGITLAFEAYMPSINPHTGEANPRMGSDFWVFRVNAAGADSSIAYNAENFTLDEWNHIEIPLAGLRNFTRLGEPDTEIGFCTASQSVLYLTYLGVKAD